MSHLDLCVITEAWLASHECFSEFRAAHYMGKRILPLLLGIEVYAGRAEPLSTGKLGLIKR